MLIISCSFNIKTNERRIDATSCYRRYLQPETVPLQLPSTYENHLKKLSQIRLDRKHQLQMDQQRNQQLQHLKNSKNKTFALKFNEQNIKVNQSNLKFLVKLEKVKAFTHYDSQPRVNRTVRDSLSSVRPSNKRQIIETEKENSRIYFKMKSVSSTLGRDKMQNDFARAQKIKDRITKYAKQDNKVELKYL